MLPHRNVPLIDELAGRLTGLLLRLEGDRPQSYARELLVVLGECRVMYPPDWAAWVFTPEARALLVEDPEALETASADVLLKLLAAHVCAERHHMGHLEEELRRGTLQRVLRRLVERLGRAGVSDSSARSGVRRRVLNGGPFAPSIPKIGQ